MRVLREPHDGSVLPAERVNDAKPVTAPLFVAQVREQLESPLAGFFRGADRLS
jgi:hypothetical protein